MDSGGMAERLKAAVLKTVNGETRSGVRIPLPPPYASSIKIRPWSSIIVLNQRNVAYTSRRYYR